MDETKLTSELPERIWLPSLDTIRDGMLDVQTEGDIEFVRADLATLAPPP